MSQIGFVYLLVNDYMPDVYKVGCTERSPHERAAELSKGTGVPAPFEVLCYIEVREFQSVERSLHTWLKNYRISENREFFQYGLEHAVGWMYHHRDRLSFCAVPDNERGGETMLVREEFSGLFPHGPCFVHLPDPWEKKAEGLGGALDDTLIQHPALGSSVNFEGADL